MNEDKAIKSASWYVISNLILKALSFITAPIFTHILTPAEYGGVSSFFAWKSIIAVFVGLGLDYTIGRAKIDFKDAFDKYLSSLQSLMIFAGIIIFCVISFIAKKCFGFFMDYSIYLIFLMVLYAISQSIISLFQSKLRFEYKYWGNIFIAFFTVLSSTGLSLFFIFFLMKTDKSLGRIFGIVFPSIFLSLFCFLSLLGKGKKLVDLTIWKYALIFSLPMIPHGLSMIILEQMDRLMIVKYVGMEEAGLYSYAYTFATILGLFVNSLMNGWQPWFFENFDKGNKDKINNSVDMLLFLLLVFLTVFVCCIPELMMLMGREEFWSAKYVAIPVIVGCFFQFLYTVFVQIELYNKKTFIISIGSISAALCNLILNYIFIPKYGYVAAGYTTLISYFMLMIYHFFICKVVFRTKIFSLITVAKYSCFILFIAIIYALLYRLSFFYKYIFCFLLIILELLVYKNHLSMIIKLAKNKFKFSSI